MASTERKTNARWPVAAGVLWVVLFLAHFFSQDLPNNSTADNPLKRTDIVEGIVQQWPVLLNPLDYSSNARIDAGWQFLGQRASFAMVATLLWLNAGLIGIAITGPLCEHVRLRRSERVVIAAGVGMSALTLWILSCGVAGQLSALSLLSPMAIASMAILWRWRSRKTADGDATGTSAPAQISGKSDAGASRRVLWLLAVPLLVFGLHIFLGGMTPPFDFDVREYHLQGPKEWYQNGQITTLKHNVYTSFPFLSEMVSLAAMVLHGDAWRGAISGKLTLSGFQFLTALAVYSMCARHASRAAGLLAAVAFLSTPWITRISVIAYAEGAITFYLAAAAATALIAAGHGVTAAHRRRLTAVCGMLAGSAMASKYPGLVSSVLPAGIMLAVIYWKRLGQPESIGHRKQEVARLAAIYAVGAALAVGPWLLKNVVATGNPVYPLGYSLFGASDWDDEMDAKWKRAHSAPDHDVRAIPSHLNSVAARNDWQSGLLFAFGIPTLLLLRRESWLRQLWFHTAWILMTWWALTHRIDRFWVPVIPLLAALAGASWHLSDSKFWRAFIVGCTVVCSIFNYGFCRLDVVGLHAGLMDLNAAREIPVRRDIRLLNSTLPDTARVLMVGEAEVFDANFDLVYNTVFDDSIFEEWTAGPRAAGTPRSERSMKTASEIRDVLAQHRITHIFVNWSEILRYRRTYGYSGYVTPMRFQQLQKHNLVEPPITMASREWNAMDAAEQAEIQSWAGGNTLKQGLSWTSVQLYRVIRNIAADRRVRADDRVDVHEIPVPQ